jgi:hypothetical protein
LTYSNGGLAVSSYSSSLNQLWYPFKVNNRLYIANGAAHSVVISYSLSGSSVNPCVSDINNCREVALPLAVPLYMQQEFDTCGPCNLSMVMNYYGLSYSESYIKESILYHYYYYFGHTNPAELYYQNGYYLWAWSENYSGFNGNSYYFGILNYSISNYETLLQSNLIIGRPPICHINTDINGVTVSPYLGYSNDGHYLTVKGLYSSNNITFVIVNDCHYEHCGEKSIPITHFYQLVMNGHGNIVSGVSNYGA